MKKLILASLAVAVTLASCEKESTIDPTITDNNVITYAPYAGSSTVTKGTPVNSNTDFAGTTGSYGAFKVASYSGDEAYFGFRTVTYSGTAWTNTDKMYWPNADADLHFAAYYPSSATPTDLSYSYASTANDLEFGYTVKATTADQEDLMYAITDYEYIAGTDDTDSADAVALHFKHALTQVGFTATKSDDINVTVKSIKVCNIVDNGTFSAYAPTDHSTSTESDDGTVTEDEGVDTGNFGTWTAATAAAATSNITNLENYTAVLPTDSTSITVNNSTTAVNLTSTSDVLMLIPQTLTAWSATATNTGTESYLAIECTITHSDGTASIIDDVIYVPFSTADITYSLANNAGDGSWLPGYKITYNLIFGGGYTIPGTDTELEPGETPDPDDVISTLRDVTYTISVDEWMTASSTDLTF